MTITLGSEIMDGMLPMREAIDLLEQAFVREAAGHTTVSRRLHTDFPGGWMRILFAADQEAGYCATKSYHLIAGVGVRYLIALYSLRQGELLALLDGRAITELRTGAVSGVVARKTLMRRPVSVGIIGSRSQARAQLESLACVYPVESAAVYSQTPARREAFAQHMSAQLGFPVTAVDSPEAAVRGRTIVATASASRQPIVRWEDLAGCRLLCAVGNTRPQYSEVDPLCFGQASTIVIDSANALEETGELLRASESGRLQREKIVTVASLAAGRAAVADSGLVAFKSAGTALQDLALAARCYEIAAQRPDVAPAGGLGSLKQK
jgi:ornithine cyclodeaminase/alanine dehydrogenase-like protein (mu-crystallin family)